MEKCVFCGWYRRTSGPALRFYGIPREPGLKRVKWLCAIGDRELSPKDKVCSFPHIIYVAAIVITEQ